jgi:hypothetical protein
LLSEELRFGSLWKYRNEGVEAPEAIAKINEQLLESAAKREVLVANVSKVVSVSPIALSETSCQVLASLTVLLRKFDFGTSGPKSAENNAEMLRAILPNIQAAAKDDLGYERSKLLKL